MVWLSRATHGTQEDASVFTKLARRQAIHGATVPFVNQLYLTNLWVSPRAIPLNDCQCNRSMRHVTSILG
jgi:hypothetical protein